jgi:hypothetical protein
MKPMTDPIACFKLRTDHHERKEEASAVGILANEPSLDHIHISKLDLLVRVRYANPLPAPPCPPKLLNIPTNPMRYARPEFLDTLTSNTPLPMIVDAECGMPLDLGRWACLWEEGADDSGASYTF